jgi:hypothetical protein
MRVNDGSRQSWASDHVKLLEAEKKEKMENSLRHRSSPTVWTTNFQIFWDWWRVYLYDCSSQKKRKKKERAFALDRRKSTFHWTLTPVHSI